MKALSIKQPWAFLIVEGWKPLENRSWHSDFRGRIWVHASKGMTVKEYDDCVRFASHIDAIPIPHFDVLQRGGIVGEVEITGCVSNSSNQWFVGPYAFVLRKPYPLPFRACPGQLGFFEPALL